MREAAAECITQVLHRSASGSAVNVLGHSGADGRVGHDGGGQSGGGGGRGGGGEQRAARWAKMLPGNAAPITACPVITPGYHTKRDSTARARVAGILAPVLTPGDRFTKGQTLATMVDIWVARCSTAPSSPPAMAG